MRQPFKKLFCIALLFSLISGCNDFFERDITNLQVNLLAPADSTVSDSIIQLFWWDHLEGAYEYQLQIVTPDFEESAILTDDTILVENKYENTLSPGNYQWRVRALNGSSSTAYSIRNISIRDTAQY